MSAIGTRTLFAGRRAELLLSVLVVAIVAMMVVPLPTQLIDLAIALNLALGVLLLCTSLYVRSVTSFAVFPTVLLLSTLYRLSLNVASTRLILLQANAGRVIDAFGHFVVRGDYLVGAMVFALLTIVQFLVIARGAERVAEVGARFSLDALPGKQLAIDAELRAGTLSAEAAREQRRQLARESQLYGALDGAMKFVKGDAIAGIVITCVNFFGGVGIGVLARGLSLTDSLATYGLLTIGDGLVTQIPALLCASAAGLVVTRVESEQPGGLAADVARQLFGDTRVLFACALLLLLLAAVPGLPAWPFACVALGFATLFVRARRAARAPQETTRSTTPELASLSLSPDLAQTLLVRGAPTHELASLIARVASRLAAELGVSLPHVQVRSDASLPALSFRFFVRELADETCSAGEAPLVAIEQHLAEAARAHAHELLDLDAVQAMLTALERQSPALVRHANRVSPAVLTRVLRLLLREGVSVRWLAEILDAIASHPSDASAEALAEIARRALAARISHTLAPDGSLHILRLAPELDEALSDALRREQSASANQEWLALSPGLARDITRAIADAHTRAPRPHALVVDPTLRRHVRALIADSAPLLPVVTPHELTAKVKLVPVALVGP